MARERRLGRKREGGWWILNSARESFQRGKMRLPRLPASKKTTRAAEGKKKKSFRLRKWQSILLICLLSKQQRRGERRQKEIEGWLRQ